MAAKSYRSVEMPLPKDLKETTLNLMVGADFTIVLDFTPNNSIKIANESLVVYQIVDLKKQVILTPRKAGDTTMLIRDLAGEPKIKYNLKIKGAEADRAGSNPTDKMGNAAVDEISLIKECEIGTMSACVEVGFSYSKIGNFEEANIFYAKACDGGNISGCHNQGQMEESLGHLSEARRVYKKACDSKESPVDCESLKKVSKTLEANNRDIPSRIKKCDEGEMKECANLAEVYQQNNQEKEATNYYKKACNGLEYSACLVLGGQAQKIGNFKEAKDLFNKVCKSNIKLGCLNLKEVEVLEDKLSQSTKKCEGNELKECSVAGILLLKINRSTEAKNMLVKACDGNIMEACLALGNFQVEQNDMVDAKNKFTKVCDNGQPLGCTRLGVLLKPTNPETAKVFLNKACNAGEMEGCLHLGNMELEYGNFDQTKNLLLKACKSKLQVACNSFEEVKKVEGKIVLMGKLCDDSQIKACNELGQTFTTYKKYKEANLYFKKSCDLKDFMGCYLQGANEKNLNNRLESFRLLKLSCDNNIISGCHGLGELQLKDNYEEAKKLFQKACNEKFKESCDILKNLNSLEEKLSPHKYKCDQGQLQECMDVGKAYAEISISIEAAKYFQKSCEGGVMDACLLSGDLAMKLDNINEAKKAHSKACEAGILLSCRSLGLVFKKQNNLAEARRWFKKSCDGDDQLGCMGLGGIEVQQNNLSAAIVLFKKACDRKVPEACNVLKKISSPAK